MAYECLSLKAMGSSMQQSTTVYNCNQSNLSAWPGQVRALILQVINALNDKGFDRTRLSSLYTATVNGS